jgi:hypothetical protein
VSTAPVSPAEQSQQHHYTCAACGSADDILGRYGYCSCCGTRNDLQELTQTIKEIEGKTRDRLAAKEPLEAAVPDAVSAFDSTARQYAKQLGCGGSVSRSLPFRDAGQWEADKQRTTGDPSLGPSTSLHSTPV